MSNIQSKLNLPGNVIETGSVIYRQALKANLIRGRTIRNLVVACIYMACRQCQIIRTLDDVAASANVSKNLVARNYRFLFNVLRPSVPQNDLKGHIARITNKLSLSGDSEKLAKLVLLQAIRIKLTVGRGPASIAAACVYISTQIVGEHRTQVEISEAAQVTEVTIRNRYKELVRRLEIRVHL
jgi:transcription initiation factor TFIIB